MSNRGPRHRRSSAASKGRPSLALLSIVVVVLMIGALLFGGVYVKMNSVQYDPQTFCPLDGPSSVYVVLIDTTDESSEIQRLSIQNQFQYFEKTISKGDLVTLYAIRSEDSVLKPLASICHPGSSEDVNEFTGNRRIAQDRFESKFRVPLLKTLNGLVLSQSAMSSPIMLGIQGAALQGFGPWQKVDNKKLIVISDMMENHGGSNHYKKITDFSMYKDSNNFQSVRSDLRGVDVEIWYLRRNLASAVQGRRHIAFWEDFFFEQKATVTRVKQIEGSN